MKHVLLALLLLAAGIGRSHAHAPADTTSAARSSGPTAPREYEAPLTAFADSINRVFQYPQFFRSCTPQSLNDNRCCA